MENNQETIENIIKFTDSVSKGLEGLKEKISAQLQESENKNEKPDLILTNWVNQADILIKERFHDAFNETYETNQALSTIIKNWIAKYRDNQEVISNLKFLLRDLQLIKHTIKIKIEANDTLSYISLTDNLITNIKNKSE